MRGAVLAGVWGAGKTTVMRRCWFGHLTRYLESIDEAWRASTLPRHRFAGLWEPTVLIEGLGFDVPVHALPLSREKLLAVEDRLARLGLRLFVRPRRRPGTVRAQHPRAPRRTMGDPPRRLRAG